MDIKILAACEYIHQHYNNWDTLANNSQTQNPFYEPWLLIPAIKHLADKNVYLVMAYEDDKLLCLWPVTCSRKRNTGLRIVRSWVHDHAFVGSPLLHNDLSVENFNKLIEKTLSFFDADAISFDYCVQWHEQSLNFLQNHQHLKRKLYSRAFIENTSSLDEHTAKYSSSRRKQFNRKKRKLEKTGFSYRCSNQTENLQDWTERYCQLENSGWKGAGRSSILSSTPVHDFYSEAIANASQLGKVSFQEIHQEEKVIASSFRWVSQQTSYEIKITYDENFESLSPGTLLEYYNLEHFFQSDIQAMDSCTSPENENLNRLWMTQTTMYHYYLFPDNIRGKISKKLVESKLHSVKKIKRFLKKEVAQKPRFD